MTTWNTGVDTTTHAPLTHGTMDPNYTFTINNSAAIPAYVATTGLQFSGNFWLPSGGGLSEWIMPAGNFPFPFGNYAWRTAFDLTGFDVTTAVFSGRWASDDLGYNILVNGVAINPATASMGQWTSFSFSNSSLGNGVLLAGQNVLDFQVRETGIGTTGVRVEYYGEANRLAVPEPGSLALAGVALAGLGLMRRARPAAAA